MGKICVRCVLSKKKKEKHRRKWTQPDHLAECFHLVKKKKEKERVTFAGSSHLENSSPNDISYEELKIGIREELSTEPQYPAQHLGGGHSWGSYGLGALNDGSRGQERARASSRHPLLWEQLLKGVTDCMQHPSPQAPPFLLSWFR